MDEKYPITYLYAKNIHPYFNLLYGFFFVSASCANTGSSSNMKLINAEELISVFNADEQGLILIDSRMPSDRQLGYIEGSVNLPDTSTDCRNLLELAPVKDRVIAFYCNSAKCRRSGRAVDIALASGYQNILWFKGGLSRMASKKYPVLKLLSNKQNH